jgi:hypothetical protein
MKNSGSTELINFLLLASLVFDSEDGRRISSKMSVNFYWSRQYHIQGDSLENRLSCILNLPNIK